MSLLKYWCIPTSYPIYNLNCYLGGKTTWIHGQCGPEEAN